MLVSQILYLVIFLSCHHLFVHLQNYICRHMGTCTCVCGHIAFLQHSHLHYFHISQQQTQRKKAKKSRDISDSEGLSAGIRQLCRNMLLEGGWGWGDSHPKWPRWRRYSCTYVSCRSQAPCGSTWSILFIGVNFLARVMGFRVKATL